MPVIMFPLQRHLIRNGTTRETWRIHSSPQSCSGRCHGNRAKSQPQTTWGPTAPKTSAATDWAAPSDAVASAAVVVQPTAVEQQPAAAPSPALLPWGAASSLSPSEGVSQPAGGTYVAGRAGPRPQCYRCCTGSGLSTDWQRLEGSRPAGRLPQPHGSGEQQAQWVAKRRRLQRHVDPQVMTQHPRLVVAAWSRDSSIMPVTLLCPLPRNWTAVNKRQTLCVAVVLLRSRVTLDIYFAPASHPSSSCVLRSARYLSGMSTFCGDVWTRTQTF